MVDVKTFDSKEEMFEWMIQQKAERQARALAPEQQGIGWGDYAVRFWENLVIFCRVETYEELVRTEDTETVAEIERVHREGSLWAFCSSRVESGEWGYQHRSVLWPISEETYKAAQQAGWVWDTLPDPARYEVEAAFNAMREATRG